LSILAISNVTDNDPAHDSDSMVRGQQQAGVFDLKTVSIKTAREKDKELLFNQPYAELKRTPSNNNVASFESSPSTKVFTVNAQLSFHCPRVNQISKMTSSFCWPS
jgi:hypothetical protein